MTTELNSLEENDSFSSGIADAVNYTKWIVDTFAPYMGSELLEVGVGAGNYLDFFPKVSRYKGLDIDPALIHHLSQKYPDRDYAVADLSLSSFDEMAGSKQFDTVFCSNVLEHIEDDKQAFERLLGVLRPGGKLLIFVPAFQQLYTDMDHLAGHYRRYTKKTLARCWSGRDDEILRFEYFNSIGGLGWWAQKFSEINELEDPGVHKKIMFFDKYILPLSRMVNPITKHFFGQSVLVVLEKKS